MGERAVQLDYGHQVPVWKRRRTWRRVVGLASIIAVVVIGYPLGRPVYNRCVFLYWQRQCLRYTAPADRIVYEDDPRVAAKLLGHGYSLFSGAYSSDPVAVDERSLTRWDNYGRECSASPLRFLQLNSANNLRFGLPLLFLHERRKNGIRRLVAVYLGKGDGRTWFCGYSGEIFSVFPQPNEGTASQLVDCGSFPLLYVHNEEPEGPHLRFYAGQPDPADDSHFTISYELGGSKGTVDGWLRDQPDSIELKVRDGPPAAPRR